MSAMSARWSARRCGSVSRRPCNASAGCETLLRMGVLRVRQLTMTTKAFPTQWEGDLDDGRELYVRYRHGWLTVTAGATVDEAVDVLLTEESEGTVLFEGEVLGSQGDGALFEAELRAALDGVLEFPELAVVDTE